MFHLHAQFIIISYGKLKAQNTHMLSESVTESPFLSSFRPWIATQTVIGCLLRASVNFTLKKRLKTKCQDIRLWEIPVLSCSPSAPTRWEASNQDTQGLQKALPVPGCPQELPAEPHAAGPGGRNRLRSFQSGTGKQSCSRFLTFIVYYFLPFLQEGKTKDSAVHITIEKENKDIDSA